MLKWVLDVFIGTAWGGILFLLGWISAGWFLDWKLDHMRLEVQIQELKKNQRITCRYRDSTAGPVMDCFLTIDPGT